MIKPEDEQKVKEKYFQSVINEHIPRIENRISFMIQMNETSAKYFLAESHEAIDKLVEHLISNGWYAKRIKEFFPFIECGGGYWESGVLISKYPIEEKENDEPNESWLNKLFNRFFLRN